MYYKKHPLTLAKEIDEYTRIIEKTFMTTPTPQEKEPEYHYKQEFDITCKDCDKVCRPSKYGYAFVPELCDECFSKGIIDMTTPEGYEEGMKAIRNDPRLSGKISVQSPFITPPTEDWEEVISGIGRKDTWEKVCKVLNLREESPSGFDEIAYLKNFISQLITSTKEEIIEKIEKERQVPVEIPHGSPYLSGYNAAIDDILQALS